jgi:hypothetical protein
MVQVPYEECSRLQKAHIEFTALKSAFVDTGTPIESIQILIDARLGASTPPSEEICTPAIQARTPERSSKRIWSKPAIPAAFLERKTWRPEDSEPSAPTTLDGYSSSEEEHQAELSRQNFKDCHKDRSIVLTGVSVHTSLDDVTKSIRGGAMLNIHRKPRERTVHVSLVESNAAAELIRHVKKHDLYVKGKRVEVIWDEKQHYMTGGVARKIELERATRNLVIRSPGPTITAESIREDLKHIHLLEVISLRFADGQVWIQLNSVHHAITGRNCMRSRYEYKSSSIQFWPDDCAQPWLEIKKSAIQPWQPKRRATISTISVNRFDGLLDYAKDEPSSESGSDA